MIRTDPGSRSLGSDPGIRFRDPRICLANMLPWWAIAHPVHTVARCGFSANLIQNPISEVELIIAPNR